jgi:hypothetical protein
MSLLEDLTRAYEFHRDNGWCKGEWRQPTSSAMADGYEYCMDGAVIYSLMESAHAAPDEFYAWKYSAQTYAVRDVLRQAIEEVTGKYHYNLPQFNDKTAKSKGDVSAVFERAIKDLKEAS